jgi:hypothetical protein
MPARSPHLDTTPVVQNVRSLANRQNQQKRGPSGNSQLPPAKRRVSVPVGKTDSSQGGSSIPSTIQGQNSTTSSSLNNFRVEDINQCVTSTRSATQRLLINTPTATLGTSSCSTPAHEPQRVVLYPAPHAALLSLPLLAEVLITFLPPSLIHKPMQSLRIHSKRKLLK